MNLLHVQNLALITTNKCNLDCCHCMRGCKDDKSMSLDVIKSTFNQINSVGNLCLCGGEITLDVETLELLFDYIIQNNIRVDEITTVINGSIYSEKMLNLFDSMDKYVKKYSRYVRNTNISFEISFDYYHAMELRRLNIYKQYLENIKRYMKSEHFYAFRVLKDDKKLFREGNACGLNHNKTVDIRPMNICVTYSDGILEDGSNLRICNIGPIITINTDGIITECDASTLNQYNIYNYGNVFDDSIEELALRRGKVYTNNKWLRETKKQTKIHNTYNK